jgi:hypothetical protein
MRKFLTARRRYAAAFVVAAASLGIIGACNPTKPPPPSEPAILTIAPNEWTFTKFGETKTFTVTNLGPGQSLPLRVGLFGGNVPPTNVFFTTFQDSCLSKTLVSGDQCTIGVQSAPAGNATWDTFLVVSSENSQLDPEFGRGVRAHLIAPPPA